MKIEQPFYPGQQFVYGGVEYRIEQGNRRPGDLLLLFRTLESGWHAPTIAHSIICLAVKWQVEENNYPRPRFQGGFKLLRAVAIGLMNAQTAIEEIEMEVRNRVKTI